MSIPADLPMHYRADCLRMAIEAARTGSVPLGCSLLEYAQEIYDWINAPTATQSPMTPLSLIKKDAS